jgi:hypothetical protein
VYVGFEWDMLDTTRLDTIYKYEVKSHNTIGRFELSKSEILKDWQLFRFTGGLDFVHRPVFWKLENNVSETESVSFLG